jgi:hypothetical protein
MTTDGLPQNDTGFPPVPMPGQFCSSGSSTECTLRSLNQTYVRESVTERRASLESGDEKLVSQRSLKLLCLNKPIAI